MTQMKRTEDFQIYAGLAARIGVLAKQYEELTKGKPENEIYDATLSICLLQSLLTNVWEEADKRGFNKWNGGFLDKEFSEDNPSFWGLEFKNIKRNSYGSMRKFTVLKQLRHAMSHPCATNPHNALYPSTGYWIPDKNSHLINSVIFVRAICLRIINQNPFKSKEKANKYISHSDELKNKNITCGLIKFKRILPDVLGRNILPEIYN